MNDKSLTSIAMGVGSVIGGVEGYFWSQMLTVSGLAVVSAPVGILVGAASLPCIIYALSENI